MGTESGRTFYWLQIASYRTVLLLQDQLLDAKNQMMKGEIKCRIESPKQG